jgi:NTE family protein
MTPKSVTLALQGGGSHGAFTWGVLDRLLEDGRVDIEGISGSSAGAINAVALAHGFTAGGPDGAREALKTLWDTIATSSLFNGSWSTPAIARFMSEPVPAVHAALFLTKFFSPYQLNPLNLNPLRDLLAGQIDFERIRKSCDIKLFVAATRVSTGTLRLFTNADLTLDAVLASACLPSLNHSVEIDGEAYWDGGLTANPPLRPLVYQCKANDMLVVLLQPLPREKVPTTVEEIWQRLIEISFSAPLAIELQGLALAKQEAQGKGIAWGRLDRRVRALNLHTIDSPQFMSEFSLHSKLNVRATFIDRLCSEGRARADQWLEESFHPARQRPSLRLAAS